MSTQGNGAAAAGGGTAAEQETFHAFFDSWLSLLDRDLEALLAASGDADEVDEKRLRHLVERVVGHCEYYCRAKTAAARADLLPMFSPTWTSPTENLLLWAGGWRPTTALQLLYSQTGLELEAQLAAGEPSIADGLSLSQLESVDALHRKVVASERETSEELAAAQESAAGPEAVGLAHMITVDKCRSGGGGGGHGVERMEGGVRGTRERMRRVLEKAEWLRLGTIKGVVEILTPAQAVRFLTAATELLHRVHEYGKSLDGGEK